MADTVASLSGPDDDCEPHTPGYERLRFNTLWNFFDSGCLGYASLARITVWDSGALTLEPEGAILATASAALHEAVLARGPLASPMGFARDGVGRRGADNPNATPLAPSSKRVYPGGMTIASDIPTDHWVDRLLPAAARPYARLMRLDRPIGTWLLLLPCWWGLALGWRTGPESGDLWEIARLYLLFSVGAVVMRGAGCTVNDLWDRDFDAKVARTISRPIAYGDISIKQALIFLVVQLLVGLAVLLQLNQASWIMGVSVLALVFTYPLFKRVTYWPQFVLGLTFNWGALMGWVAVTGALGWPSVALYCAGIVWTLGYDTIYAHQDKTDDALIGVKSSALALGDRTVRFLWIFYGLTMTGLIVAGWIAGLPVYFYLLLIPAAAQLSWQAWRLNIDDPKDCLAKFRSNRYFGYIITVAILVG